MKTNILFMLMTLVLSAATAQANIFGENLRHFVACGGGDYDIIMDGNKRPPSTDSRSTSMSGKWGRIYLYYKDKLVTELFPVSSTASSSASPMTQLGMSVLVPTVGNNSFISRDGKVRFNATGKMDIENYRLVIGNNALRCEWGTYIKYYGAE